MKKNTKNILSNNSALVIDTSLEVSKVKDYLQLVKITLTLIVVLTAVGAYLIASQFTVSFKEVLILGLGGFFVTAASNTLNQVLERDYDKLMSRTMDRPLAAGRMTISEAVLAAGLFSLLGITLLALFNPLCGLLGMIALILYAFVYTPLKRYSSAAVFIGAIAGALPMLIGVVAFTAEITLLALALFLVQFFWQYPHFWAIGFKGYKDYKKAGFQFVPEGKNLEKPSTSIATSSVWMSIAIIPCLGLLTYGMTVSIASLSMICILSIGYIGLAFRFYSRFDDKTALHLLLGSFAYIPLFLLVLILGTL